MNKIVKEKLKEAMILFIIIITFGCVLGVMLRYETEGEVNMPFNLSEMLVISSVDETQKSENAESKELTLDINQYNDIYLKLEKNPNYEESSYIESVTIEKIKIKTNEENHVYSYIPSSTDGKKFEYEDNYIINSSLTYNGSTKDNEKTLEVGNQGGMILFRIANKSLGEYVLREDEEIAYDGTLLKKLGVSEDKLKMDVSFDIVIKTNKSKYRGNINLILPYGNILEEGICKLDQTDFSKVAFKREK